MYQVYMRNHIRFQKYMKLDINKYKVTSLFLDRKTPYYQTSIVPKLIYKFNLFLKEIPPVPY